MGIGPATPSQLPWRPANPSSRWKVTAHSVSAPSRSKPSAATAFPSSSSSSTMGVYRGDETNPPGDAPAPTVLAAGARHELLIEAFGGTGYHVQSPDELAAALTPPCSPAGRRSSTANSTRPPGPKAAI